MHFPMPELAGRQTRAAGADAEFAAWYEEQRPALHAYLLGRTGDPEAALDLFQETFLRAWRHFPLLRTYPPDRRRYWLFAVARNVTIDHHRGLAGMAIACRSLGERGEQLVAEQPTPPELMERREAVSSVTSAINRLPEDWRTALVLQTLGELSSAEIGTLLGVPAGTVRYWIVRARRRLAVMLELTSGNPRGGTTNAQ